MWTLLYFALGFVAFVGLAAIALCFAYVVCEIDNFTRRLPRI